MVENRAEPGGGARATQNAPGAMPLVKTFHQIVIWPLQLPPLQEGPHVTHHWEVLERTPDCPWKELDDEFCADPAGFQERHYREFVTFLPYVQRLLYGEGAKRRSMAAYGESPIKVYRRSDVTQARIVLDRGPPVTFTVNHADLYFFYDVDLVILAFEVSGEDVPLDVAQDMLHRFGRAYPAGWTEAGDGLNCPRKVEWLGADGKVLAESDYEDRAEYLASVCRERAPSLAAHWKFLLQPMVAHHSEEEGALRFRQLEYYRMPLMAYLAVDRPELLTRADYVRLAFGTGPGDRNALPYSERYLEDFEKTYCYDRYYDAAHGVRGLTSRAVCTGHAFVLVGDAAQPFFLEPERGILAQFRHQFFMLALIVHLHKAALLMLSDRMVRAVTRLEVGQAVSTQRFRRDTRATLEVFLRFTHRYWFQEVSDHVQARDVFRLLSDRLETGRLYTEVREDLHSMGNYLDSDLLRRQSRIVLRLTVVTIAGLVGTTVTGFLGMNLISEADAPLGAKVLWFVAVTAAIGLLTLYTLLKSRGLSDFLDALSDEDLTTRAKIGALLDVWRRKR